MASLSTPLMVNVCNTLKFTSLKIELKWFNYVFFLCSWKYSKIIFFFKFKIYQKFSKLFFCIHIGALGFCNVCLCPKFLLEKIWNCFEISFLKKYRILPSLCGWWTRPPLLSLTIRAAFQSRPQPHVVWGMDSCLMIYLRVDSTWFWCTCHAKTPINTSPVCGP